MKKWIILSLFALFFSCKEKKADLSGTHPVKINDFIAAFSILPLPFTASDTTIGKVADTTTIGYKAFNQFIPDSIIETILSVDKKIIIHPVGRIEKAKETYLLATLSSKKKIQLAAFVLDNKNKFLSSKVLLSNTNEDGYSHSVSINKEPTFLISQEKTNSEKQLQFSRVGWVYNSGKTFTVVMNDGNEDPIKTKIINPIDTLPHKNKFSGNYTKDNKNFISLRDGRDANNYVFFLHIEKKDGTCIGELKGSLRMKTAVTAVYQESGDPCILNFIFNSNQIDIKETGSCGNRRGMNCLIDESFTKKKEPKSSRKK
jgi:hypothetical protein